MIPNTYEIRYIKTALSSQHLGAPDKSSSNGNGEVLVSLFTAHKMGGVDAAKMAWETILRLRPDLRAIDQAGSNWLYADDLKNLTIPQYALTEYPIYEFGLNAIVGQSGGGKSFVCLDIAGKIAREKKVLYIAAEGLHGYSSRWEAWKRHNRINENRNLIFYSKEVGLMEEANVSAFINELKTEICPDGVSMIVVDTVARCMYGGDENSTRDMAIFIHHVDVIRREMNCGMILVHHTGKSGSMRGNTSLPGAVDSIVFLKREDDQIVLYNSFEQGGKNKYAAEQPPKYLKLLPVDVEIQGKPVSSAVVIQAERFNVSPAVKTTLTTNQQLILEALEPHDSGVKPDYLMEATNISQATLYRVLNHLKKMEYITKQDNLYTITDSGREALFG